MHTCGSWRRPHLQDTHGTHLDKKNGATTTVEAPKLAHSAMASAIVGLASSICAVLTILRCAVALLSAYLTQASGRPRRRLKKLGIHRRKRVFTYRGLRTLPAWRLPRHALTHGLPKQSPPGRCGLPLLALLCSESLCRMTYAAAARDTYTRMARMTCAQGNFCGNCGWREPRADSAGGSVTVSCSLSQRDCCKS